MQAFAIDDIAQVDVLAITDGNVLQYVADNAPPLFMSFDLSLNTSQLILTFDEPINALSHRCYACINLS